MKRRTFAQRRSNSSLGTYSVSSMIAMIVYAPILNVLRRGKAVRIRYCPATVRRGPSNGHHVKPDTSRRNKTFRGRGHDVHTTFSWSFRCSASASSSRGGVVHSTFPRYFSYGGSAAHHFRRAECHRDLICVWPWRQSHCGG